MDWIESEMAMVSTKAIKLSISLILFLINLVTYDLVLLPNVLGSYLYVYITWRNVSVT